MSQWIPERISLPLNFIIHIQSVLCQSLPTLSIQSTHRDAHKIIRGNVLTLIKFPDEISELDFVNFHNGIIFMHSASL